METNLLSVRFSVSYNLSYIGLLICLDYIIAAWFPFIAPAFSKISMDSGLVDFLLCLEFLSFDHLPEILLNDVTCSEFSLIHNHLLWVVDVMRFYPFN